MSVAQVANFLCLTPDRVRQLADMWRDNPRRGLPHIRFGPRRERFFAENDVEAFKLRRLEIAEQRIEHLMSWRAPVAAMRS